jgi:hypothetical protein
MEGSQRQKISNDHCQSHSTNFCPVLQCSNPNICWPSSLLVSNNKSSFHTPSFHIMVFVSSSLTLQIDFLLLRLRLVHLRIFVNRFFFSGTESIDKWKVFWNISNTSVWRNKCGDIYNYFTQRKLSMAYSKSVVTD